MPPALDQATTLPSVSVMVTTVLLNEACTCASPWWTMRFSPRFLKVFLRLPAPSFFSGVAPSGAASVFAIWLYRLLLRDRALARTFAGARIGAGPLSAHRERAAMTHAAVAADFHQPLDVHRDFLAQVALDAALLFDHAADLPDIVFGQILDPDVGADAR